MGRDPRVSIRLFRRHHPVTVARSSAKRARHRPRRKMRLCATGCPTISAHSNEDDREREKDHRQLSCDCGVNISSFPRKACPWPEQGREPEEDCEIPAFAGMPCPASRNLCPESVPFAIHAFFSPAIGQLLWHSLYILRLEREARITRRGFRLRSDAAVFPGS
jgi:hypothetical protein